MQKISQFHQFFLEIQPILESRDQIGHTLIFDQGKPKTFQSTFNFCEFVSTCKNEVVSSIYSAEMLHLKILQSEWLRAFWPISQENIFPK